MAMIQEQVELDLVIVNTPAMLEEAVITQQVPSTMLS